MATTYVRLDQVRKAFSFDDTLTASQIASIETDAVDQEDFQTGILSQMNRTIGATNWWDNIQNSAGQPRNLKTLTDDVYYKDMMRWRINVNDVTVPAQVRATGTLTGVDTFNFVDTETVTIGTKVYTFQDTLTDVDGNVHIGADFSESMANLKAAINLETPINGRYADSMSLHTTVEATASAALTLSVRAKSYGAAGNAIATTETATQASWGSTTLTGGVNGDCVILVEASSQTPAETAAVDDGSANGAICKVLGSGEFGISSLSQVGGLNYLQPKNGCLVRDASTFDPILSDGRLILALLQAEVGVVDGDTFNDVDQRAQLTFVRSNAAGTALELCPVADISGKTINYSYGSRTELNLANEQDFQFFAFADLISIAAITLQQAYIGGNTISVQTSEGNLVFNLSDDLTQFEVQRNTAAFFTLLRDDTLGDKLKLDADLVDINTTGNPDFNVGIKVGTTAQTINLGVTSGTIDSTTLTVKTTTGDLSIEGFDDVLFKTVRQGTAIPLDDATAGAISALPGGPYASISAAIRAALTSAQIDVYTQTLANSYARDVNVPGATETWSPALDLTNRTIDTISPAVPDTVVFLNGVLLRGGNGTTNNDVYKGTTPANGDLKYDFLKGVKVGDMVTVFSWKAGAT